MRIISKREHAELRRLRARAFRVQNGLCYWCKQPMILDGDDSDPFRCSGDHLIPIHNGGQTIAGNVVAACQDCNGKRHPELDSLGGGTVATYGDDRPISPFAILARLIGDKDAN
jgi:5-methylcytosine-specific restriction endonuclease McrA